MCGRVRLPDDVRLIKEELKIRWDEHREPEKRYNVPPSIVFNVVTYDRERDRRRECYRTCCGAKETRPGRRSKSRAGKIARKRNQHRAGESVARDFYLPTRLDLNRGIIIPPSASAAPNSAIVAGSGKPPCVLPPVSSL